MLKELVKKKLCQLKWPLPKSGKAEEKRISNAAEEKDLSH